MNVDEVLSVLGQMELDMTQELQRKRSLQHIGEVLKTFKATEAKRAQFQAECLVLEQKQATLRARYDAKRDAELVALEDTRAKCTVDRAEQEQQQAGMRQKMNELDHAVVLKDAEVAVKLAQLDAKIVEKTKQLTQLTESILSLKQAHALV